MVPSTLGDWTYDVVDGLCASGQSESDRHDFKFNVAELKDATKICCAFANSFGGFIITGVKDARSDGFKIVGLDPDKELYGKFLAKVKADPDIAISPPKMIVIPDSSKLLYVFEIPQSSRRPHLPSPADQRVFWKRQGSDCVQMTLEEIRYQMNTYEEKREKLALLLIDLQHKVLSLADQAATADGHYTGDTFSFEIIDRIVVEAYAILKVDINILRALETIRQRLMALNVQKQQVLTILTMSYDVNFKKTQVNRYREFANSYYPEVTALAQQIERSINERFGIVNPYKV